jgi:hypothetical protein
VRACPAGPQRATCHGNKGRAFRANPRRHCSTVRPGTSRPGFGRKFAAGRDRVESGTDRAGCAHVVLPQARAPPSPRVVSPPMAGCTDSGLSATELPSAPRSCPARRRQHLYSGRGGGAARWFSQSVTCVRIRVLVQPISGSQIRRGGGGGRGRRAWSLDPTNRNAGRV